MIVALGLGLLDIKRLRVASMLPALAWSSSSTGWAASSTDPPRTAVALGGRLRPGRIAHVLAFSRDHRNESKLARAVRLDHGRGDHRRDGELGAMLEFAAQLSTRWTLAPRRVDAAPTGGRHWDGLATGSPEKRPWRWRPAAEAGYFRCRARSTRADSQRVHRSAYLASLNSSRPRYGFRPQGVLTGAVSFWYVSRMAAMVRGNASALPFKVCTLGARGHRRRGRGLQAPRLERLHVADARDLQPALLPRAPHFRVVLLGLGEAHVAGAHEQTR